jgi:DNA-binding response OmpR family regulator
MAGEAVLVIDDSPTILKVVQLVLTKAGFVVHTASDGEEGIDKALKERPDLILLDFVMPKMNGYQVCRALTDLSSLKEVPVVLMSAKGDQVGERFVKVMGIVDYITKPFSPEAITAVVQHTVAKYPKRDTTSVGEKPEAPPIETTSQTPRAAADESGPAPEDTRERTLNELRMRLGELSPEMATALKSIDDARLVGAAPLILHALWPLGGSALEGNLADVPVSEVLGLLAAQRQWGIFTVERADGARVVLAFKQGKIELGHGDKLSDELLLGRFLVEASTMSRHDLDLFLEGRAPTTRPLGEQLVKMSYVTQDELKQALTRQTQERVFELLRWPAGRFNFTSTHELPPLALEAGLGLDVDGILMEGFRRVDEWHLIEREIDDFDAVLLRNEEAVQNVGKARLTRDELAVLELVNGKNSVKDIVRLSRMASFDVTKMLFRLLSIKVIRRRVAPVAV